MTHPRKPKHGKPLKPLSVDAEKESRADAMREQATRPGYSSMGSGKWRKTAGKRAATD